MKGLVRIWKYLEGLDRAWKDLKGLVRIWKYLEGLERAWKDLKGLERTWKDLKELERTWEDLKGLARTWKSLKEFERTPKKCKIRKSVTVISQTADRVTDNTRTREACTSKCACDVDTSCLCIWKCFFKIFFFIIYNNLTFFKTLSVFNLSTSQTVQNFEDKTIMFFLFFSAISRLPVIIRLTEENFGKTFS